MRRSFLAAAMAWSLTPAVQAADFAASAGELFAGYCITCHDPVAKKAGLNLLDLAWRPGDPETFNRWVKVFDKVDKHKMPPPNKKQPSPAARAEFLKSLGNELRIANLDKQQTEGRVVLRRLNRVEYENTLQDLLAIDVPLQHFLPEDASVDGFDNVATGLRLSMLHMQQYLDAADAAINAAMDLRRRPSLVKKRLRYHDEESVRDDLKRKDKEDLSRIAGCGRHLRRQFPDGPAAVDRSRPWALPDPDLRASVPGCRTPCLAEDVLDRLQNPAIARLLRLARREAASDGTDHHARGRPLTQSQPVRHQLRRRRPPQRLTGESAPKRIAAAESPSSGSKSRARCSTVGRRQASAVCSVIFPSMQVDPSKKSARPSRDAAFAIVPENPRIGRGHGPAGFRVSRVPPPAHLRRRRPFRQTRRNRARPRSVFRECYGVAFRAVITSPRFLFLDEQPGQLDAWALACRLSYFLWSTLPDEELRKLAADGSLTRPEVLRGQVERMLASARSRAFVENFVGQWLDLRQIDFTLPDRKLYPEFDDILKAAMVGEIAARSSPRCSATTRS